MNPRGILGDLLTEIGSFDWPFVEWRLKGPSDATSGALNQFWKRPEFRDVQAELGLPHLDWGAVEACLAALSDGAVRAGSFETWLQVAATARELETREPLVATISALYAMAAWEGALGEQILDHPGSEFDIGWLVFPMVTARNLLAADAVWGALLTIRWVLWFLQVAHRNLYDAEFAAELHRHQEFGAQVEAYLDERITELAWDLRVACTGDDNLRPEVAAVLWTLGHVPHAELLGVEGDPGYQPDMDLMRETVRTSIRRIPSDSLLQYVWLEMKDRPRLDLRGHRSLFARVNAVYRSTLMHLVDSTGIPASRGFAQAAIAYFRCDLSMQTRDALALALSVEHLTRDRLARLRIRALATLVLFADGDASKRWRLLAAESADILASSTQNAVFEPFDGCLDLPFYYAEADDEQDAPQFLRAIERYRCAGATHWLTVAPPRARSDKARLAPLLERESKLLGQLQASRLLRMLPIFPPHYQRAAYALRDVSRKPPPGAIREEVRGVPFEYDPLNQDLALRELQTANEALVKLWKRMAKIDPEYAEKRLDPFADVEAFVNALMIDRLPARPPVAPAPALRTV